MLLYHGSNVEVQTPRILEKLRALDFGAGFYLTSSKAQAIKWAKVVAKRNRSNQPMLNTYVLAEENLHALKVLKFETANADWLDFVVSNRKGFATGCIYDLVIGPVANDSTLPVIDDYISGVYNKEEAVKRLLPQNLTDQYAFLSDRALQYIAFKGSEGV